MDIVTALAMGKSLLELGQEIGKVIKKAQDSPDVTRRVLLYLQAAQAAVNALGQERQHILTDVRRCDVSDPDQVRALWQRLDRYLHEDNIRPQLDSAIRGLTACRAAIERKAKAGWWRNRDKEAAVKAFTTTLNELESTLEGLTSNFYPGGSGMGIQTLVPIYDLVSQAHQDQKAGHFSEADVQTTHEMLGELARQALRDESHEAWFRQAGKVEALVAELQLAFAIKVTEQTTADTPHKK